MEKSATYTKQKNANCIIITKGVFALSAEKADSAAVGDGGLTEGKEGVSAVSGEFTELRKTGQ